MIVYLMSELVISYMPCSYLVIRIICLLRAIEKVIAISIIDNLVCSDPDLPKFGNISLKTNTCRDSYDQSPPSYCHLTHRGVTSRPNKKTLQETCSDKVSHCLKLYLFLKWVVYLRHF